jgi:hypothetical protein
MSDILIFLAAMLNVFENSNNKTVKGFYAQTVF